MKKIEAIIKPFKLDEEKEALQDVVLQGVTVLEAIQAFEKVTGQSLNYEIGPRRPGDVVAIYSNYQQAAERLAWEPLRGIEEIMQTAWEWEKRRSAPARVS